MKSLPILYIVVPCYNEEEALPLSAPVFRKKLGDLIDAGAIAPESRIVLVDDGSKDATWSIIRSLHESDAHFTGLRQICNRGHQNALTAGLMWSRARCDITISIDADLQDDIDAMDKMVEKYKEGCGIVCGVRASRATDTFLKRTTARGYYGLMKLFGSDLIYDHADYRLMSRETLDALSEYHEVNLFLRGIVPTLGYQTSKVYYERGEREAGESKYPLKKMIAFAIQGITSFSTKPLSFVTGAGLLSILVAIGMFVYVLVSLGFGHAIAGWGSMMISIWLIGGLIMLSLGIVGEYVGKIYMESKHRPRYRIETTL